MKSLFCFELRVFDTFSIFNVASLGTFSSKWLSALVVWAESGFSKADDGV